MRLAVSRLVSSSIYGNNVSIWLLPVFAVVVCQGLELSALKTKSIFSLSSVETEGYIPQHIKRGLLDMIF